MRTFQDNFETNKRLFISSFSICITVRSTDAGAFANFHASDNSASFKFKQKITGVTNDNGKRMLK